MTAIMERSASGNVMPSSSPFALPPSPTVTWRFWASKGTVPPSMYSTRTPPASRNVACPIETMSSSVSSAWFTRWPLTKVPLWLPRSKIWYRPVGDIFSSACALETPRSCTTMSLSGRRPIFTTRADWSLMREVGSRSTPGSDACGSALPQPSNGDTPGAAGDDPREAGGAAGGGGGGAAGGGGRRGRPRRGDRFELEPEHRPVLGVADVDYARAVDVEPGDPLGARVGAVPAALVLEHPDPAGRVEHGVVPGDPGVGHRDVGAFVTADPVLGAGFEPMRGAHRADQQRRCATRTMRHLNPHCGIPLPIDRLAPGSLHTHLVKSLGLRGVIRNLVNYN